MDSRQAANAASRGIHSDKWSCTRLGRLLKAGAATAAAASFALLSAGACGSERPPQETPAPTETSAPAAGTPAPSPSPTPPATTPPAQPVTPTAAPEQPVASPVTSETRASSGPKALVHGEINVRTGPGTEFAALDTAVAGEWFSITGKSADGDWWRITFDGGSGWIFAPLVEAIHAHAVTPVDEEGNALDQAGDSQGTAAEPLAEPYVTLLGLMNVREGPGTHYAIIYEAATGEQFPVTGKSADGEWWRIRFGQRDGWIFAPYVEAVGAQQAPIVVAAQGAGPAAGDGRAHDAAQPAVTVNGLMNVRAGPGTAYHIIGEAAVGQTFSVTGRNATGDWWQIRFNGGQGWIYGPFVTASGVDDVPERPAPPLAPPASAPAADPDLRGQRATIIHVVDGDTLDVLLQDGATERVRLFDVDAPETQGNTACFGQEATAFAAGFGGQTVGVEGSGRDLYDRLLAYVWLNDGSTLNEKLARQGYAKYDDFGNPGAYAARIQLAARLAQEENLGLWSTCE